MIPLMAGLADILSATILADEAQVRGLSHRESKKARRASSSSASRPRYLSRDEAPSPS